MKLSEILKICCDEFNIDPALLKSADRRECIAKPRFITALAMRQFGVIGGRSASFGQVGKVLGDRHYSTVMGACRRGRELIGSEQKYADAAVRIWSVIVDRKSADSAPEFLSKYHKPQKEAAQ